MKKILGLLLLFLIVSNLAFAQINLTLAEAQFYLKRHYEVEYLEKKTEAQDSIITKLEEKTEAQKSIIENKDLIIDNVLEQRDNQKVILEEKTEAHKKEIKKYKRRVLLSYGVSGLIVLLVLI